MSSHQCLNCHQDLSSNYCANCGQKSSTHRYSLVHFFEHDFVHGIWHVDKGILFTLKELFTRPGHSIREYVLGKRANYFNFFTLIVLTIGLSSILAHYSGVKISDLMPESTKEMMNSMEEFMSKYPKAVLLMLIPVYSIFSFLWFRKAGYNYSEHLVLNAYRAAGELIIGLSFNLIAIFYKDAAGLLFIYYFIFTVINTSYSIWFYYQFFSESGYSKLSLFLRSLMVPFSYILISLLIGFVLGIIKSIAS